MGLCACTYIFLGTVTGFNIRINYISWFMAVYIIASYIRNYPKNIFDNKKLWGNHTRLFMLLSLLSVFVCTIFGKNAYRFATDSNTFLAVGTGLTSFLYFKNLKIQYNNYINKVARSTFGVLLIHANSDTMRKWLWQDVLKCVSMYESPYLILYAFGSVILIWFICTLIDMARIHSIEKPLFEYV